MRFNIFIALLLCSFYSSAFEPVGTNNLKMFQYSIGFSFNRSIEYENDPRFRVRNSGSNLMNIGLDAALSYHLGSNIDLKVGANIFNELSIFENDQGINLGKWSDSGIKYSMLFFNKKDYAAIEIGGRIIPKRSVIENSDNLDLDISGKSLIVAFEKNTSRYFQDKLGVVSSFGYEHYFMDVKGVYHQDENYENSPQFGKLFLIISLVGEI